MTSEKKNYKMIRFYVGGMACAFCASTIEKGLKKLQGIRSVRVSLESGEALINYDASLITTDKIRGEIERLGYYVFDKGLDSLAMLRDSRKRALYSWFLTTLSLIITLPMMIRIYVLPNYTFFINISIVTFNLVYVALPIHRGALNAVKKGILNEHVLYGVAGVAAYILGIFGFLRSDLREFLFISALLTSLHLTAGWLGSLLRYNAEKTLLKILEIRPPLAHLLDGRDVPITELKKGDVVIVKPGEKVPLDGVVINGESEVSEAMITGESEPIVKKEGDSVIGGSTNGSGYLIVRVSENYSDSYVSRILALIDKSKQVKSYTLTFFDKIVDKVWVPLILATSFLTFLVWAILGSWKTGIINALLVSAIGYPCAIGFSYPSMGLTLFQRYLDSGLLIKNIWVLEKFNDIKVVVIDKTGTLTYGSPVVKEFRGNRDALIYAASVERFSSHPLAKAIVEYARREKSTFLEVLNFKEIPGKGVLGEIEGKEIFVGKADTIYCDPNIATDPNIIVCVDGKRIGEFVIEDELRKDAIEFIEVVKSMGMKLVLLSGDRKDKVKSIAELTGLDEYFGGLSPEDKVRIVRQLKENLNGNLLMIGDGVNDSAALAFSDISVVMGNGVDISKNVSDIVLVSNEFKPLLQLLRRRNRVSKALPSNVIIALAYNAIGIPLAALGELSGIFAMFIMMLSLLSVFGNAKLFAKYM